VASRAGVVLTSLPQPDIVREAVLGADGIAKGTRIQTFVDLSTTGPAVAIEIAEALSAKGITAIDAPVSGGVRGAGDGTLAIMFSGPGAAYEAIRPMLDVLGRCFHVGERPGMGQLMKLANNMLSATAMAASTEVVAMGVKAGLDPRIMIEVINAGTGANTAIRDKFPKAVLTRTFDFGFTTGLMHKDVELWMAEAQRLGVPMRVCETVRELWADTDRRFGPGSDFTNIVRRFEEDTGIRIESA
jgi:3-hydroxyisobutyrate dehydrogenase-like beta-hydroxyacid dehydrogenase